MSDFFNTFWSNYITWVTITSILACLALLWFSGKTKALTDSDNTTGHVWDGDLREMNNPLPRWWVWLFVITVIFAFIYLALYPGLGSYEGKLNWSSKGQLKSEVDKANAQTAPLYATFAAMTPKELTLNPAAMGIGERLFMNNCAQCHGSDAAGSKGFPNLTDKDWLWGSTPELIRETIAKGRIGNMPPMAAAVGTSSDISDVAHYVLSLSSSTHEPQKSARGQAKFSACAACHGPDGRGNAALGAPNLTDNIWLHGAGEAAIAAMVQNGKINQMPAWTGVLTDDQIHVLTAYVLKLSGQ